MDKVAQLANIFTTSGAELAVVLAESIKREDREAYDRIKAGVAQGMRLVISVVTAVKESPEVRLEVVDHHGERMTLASIGGQMTLNA